MIKNYIVTMLGYYKVKSRWTMMQLILNEVWNRVRLVLRCLHYTLIIIIVTTVMAAAVAARRWYIIK